MKLKHRLMNLHTHTPFIDKPQGLKLTCKILGNLKSFAYNKLNLVAFINMKANNSFSNN